MAKLSKQEKKVVNLLGEAAVKFGELPLEHPDDAREFALAIHAAQNIVLARVGLRAMWKGHKRPWEERPADPPAKPVDAVSHHRMGFTWVEDE
jgi:hypothetical protein